MVIMGAEYRDLIEFQRKLQKMQADSDAVIEDAARELAGRLLNKVKKRTPVGVYPHRTGGNLRRNWTIGPIRKEGHNFVVEIENPTEYASYVEYGHRTVNHKGWVKGRFMLTISEKEIKNIAPKVLEKKLQKWLNEALK
jgi:hypothetical protein